jgi:hypothetical protein
MEENDCHCIEVNIFITLILSYFLEINIFLLIFLGLVLMIN